MTNAEPRKASVDSRWLRNLASDCLNLPIHEIDPRVPLVRYGLDSLAAAELTGAIAEGLGREVPDSLLLVHQDINSIEHYIKSNQFSAELVTARIDDSLSTTRQMLADSILPDDVRPELAKQAPNAPRSILVTGATGFLGAYILNTCLRKTAVRAYCLVRPEERVDIRDRIRQNLEFYGIWDSTFESRIHPVPGDLLRPALGLAEDEFEALCRNIDEIYHCAAVVNWVFPYGGLRDVNVLGTLELLRLACKYKQKPFHFVSTMAVCYSTSGPEEVTERDNVFSRLDGIHLGYAQSKCVAEALVQAANERGLPATIYRPSLISGDSRSGVSQTGDLLSILIKGCIEMGSAPDLDWALDCGPVDYVAEAIVGLSRMRYDPARVFHLANPKRRHWRELVLWMNLFGYQIRLISYQDWLKRVESESRTPEHPLQQLRSFFLTKPILANGLTLPELYEEGRRSHASGDSTQKILSTLPIQCPVLSARLLERYFASFVDQGFMPPVPCKSLKHRVAVDKRLDHDFFSNILRNFYDDKSIQIRELSVLPGPSESSIITELTSWLHGHAAGLSRHRVVLEADDNGPAPESLDLFVKVKPKDQEVLEVGESLAAFCGKELGQTFARSKHRIGVAGCHVREIAVYSQEDKRFRKHAPVVFGAVRSDERNDWILVMESLSGMTLMDSVEDTAGWQREHVEAALRGISEVHAIWYGREGELLTQPWLGHTFSATAMVEMTELWVALADYSARYFSEWIGSDTRPLQGDLIDSVGCWWQYLERMPRTLTHNDFNPRNIAFRGTDRGLRLCAYDWELATLGVPQHDLAELLCFTLKPELSVQEVLHYVDFHRRALERASGLSIEADVWLLGFRLSLCDLILNRIPMYCMVHTVRRQQFLERVTKTWRALYDYFCRDVPWKSR